MITYIRKQRLCILKAQSMLEYSVLIACVVAGLIAMQIYMKRSIEGRLKQAADEIGEHYAPEATTSDITMVRNTTQTIDQELVHLTNGKAGPWVRDTYTKLPIYGIKSNVVINETINRSGNEELEEFEDELFE
jgi:hypothetical protein